MRRISLIVAGLLLSGVSAAAEHCGSHDVQLQVLGSGGPELADRRAASSYLVWVQGKPRLLIDIGSGSALRFREAGAAVADLDAILLSQLRSDDTADLPALLQSSAAEKRQQPLPIFGPIGRKQMPSTVTFVRTLFDAARGVYRHLGDFLSPLARDTYKLDPHDVHEKPAKLGVARKPEDDILPVLDNLRLRVTATYVVSDQGPALAWRVESGGKALVFAGDARGGARLERLVRGADLLVVPHAIPENAAPGDDLRPSDIGRLARASGVRQLVLAHRTRATFGQESATTDTIRREFSGPVSLANDLECFVP
jgi:ribonuclease BN (tRNA processing enzyme)